MNATADLKVELLRPVEQLCYQVAHYLLGNADDAAAASEDALVELYQTPMFAVATEEERRALAQAAAVRNALRLAGKRIPVH